jgi:hypothetical protein
VVANTADVSRDTVRLVTEGQPTEKLSFHRAGAFLTIVPNTLFSAVLTNLQGCCFSWQCCWPADWLTSPRIPVENVMKNFLKALARMLKELRR